MMIFCIPRSLNVRSISLEVKRVN